MDLKKIKIAHILHSVGGLDIYVRFVLDNIDNCKFCSVVLHGKNDTNRPFLDKDKEPVKAYRTSIVRDISFIKDLKAIFEIYNILKKERPDIIHAHSAKGGIMGRVVGRLLNIKVIHTPHAFSYLSAETKIKRNIFLLIERFFSKGDVILLATSNSELNRGLNEVKFDLKNAFYLNNSINSINCIPNLSIPRNWPNEYICTVGRPSYQKNIELMIEILGKINEYRDVHLVVMGVGPVSYRLSHVQDLIKKKNLEEKITLINWTNRDNILSIINDAKLYISTSRYEGMPYSVIESLALSKPCLVSNCDGNVDLIKDGFNGFVVSDENIDTFVEKALYLLSDENALKQFSNNAFTSFNADYNISKNIIKLEAFYKEHSINN
jgi:glycosyltransferase involved in cell wall biosynthesis